MTCEKCKERENGWKELEREFIEFMLTSLLLCMGIGMGILFCAAYGLSLLLAHKVAIA